MAYYCLHKFHWKPSEILDLSEEDIAFIYAAIDIKRENDEKEQKKLKAKKPRKR